ncbi:MAG: glycoside hydrolase family 65 protein [Culicoidibacterales bacterium]
MMNYTRGTGEFENWIVSETAFSTKHLGKCEAIMCLGNGYMGMRSATEETYVGEVRDTFIAGTFNKFDEHEVTELPNVADVIGLTIKVDGERFSLEFGQVKEYVRELNVKTAQLTRSFVWTSPAGKEIRFEFNRFISLANKHLIANTMEVTPLTADIEFEVLSGINAQMSNTGSQHFSEGERRIYDKKFIQLVQTTTESQVDIVVTTCHNITVGGEEVAQGRMDMDRRKVWLTYATNVPVGQTFRFEKLSTIHTSRDLGLEEKSLAELTQVALTGLQAAAEMGIEALRVAHVEAWQTHVWNQAPITIDAPGTFDQLAIRFAQYHLTVMTPAHDSRMGIGAKGLSGEGYKGHSFWDTEVFILPYFIYTNPETARSLLEYRYQGLVGARKKAAENGYEGAMYPWEAAWPTDGEVTPVWGAVDVITGKQTKIWSGFIEQHITADIANAVWQYYMITGDQAFMDDFGYEMLFDTARFWISRLEWNEETQFYGINNVIGPDEYKEHVNNNAFTNYMAFHNIELAMEYYEVVKMEKPALFAALNEKLGLEASMTLWQERVGKIYLPQPNEELLVPQDDTYLTKEIIDLTKYKNQTKVGSMFLEYSLDQVNEMQVSKQADIMALFFLLEDKFSQEVKLANYNYYEPKTLHDSSLSLSTHCILANDLNDPKLAYELFSRAAEIDLGPAMNTSDHGIHAASLGGIWQCVVMGFAGVRMLGGKLRIQPKLPTNWNELTFKLYWQGQVLLVTVSQTEVTLTNTGSKAVTIELVGTQQTIEAGQTVTAGV